ncbi:hypothetical protein ACET3Z_001177 [Daucus carota]
MSTAIDLNPSENPKQWRFWWESQSQLPILNLHLFNPQVKPLAQCTHLKLNLLVHNSLLELTWFQSQLEVFLRVPFPRVLVDSESPLTFKLLEDHIQVKFCLLLSVDHPLVSSLDNVILLEEERRRAKADVERLKMDYDIECLSSTGGVYFYCRNCSTKLSASLRTFEEMPSVNWREVADNWFGNCCCSFGGISEKLVISYAKSYTSTKGLCLLNTSSVILSKDDLVGFNIPDWSLKEDDELDLSVKNGVHKATGIKDDMTMPFHGQTEMMDAIDSRLNKLCFLKDELKIEVKHEVVDTDALSQVSPTLEDIKHVPSSPGHYSKDHDIKCCDHSGSEPSAKELDTSAFELLENQKSFLDGYLGNVFMTRTSNLTKDVRWFELSCPCCSCLLGAYPRGNSNVVFDDGVHLFKCYISTCSDAGASGNLFRMYTLERMFSSQLLECAKDELSFRTVIRDLQTKRPILKIVLLNPNSWCCFGYCSSTVDQVSRINMSPAIKLLFSDCSKSDECELRMIEEWVVKNQADEVYMLASQIEELIRSLELVKNVLPPSHSLLQGFSLSSLRI